MGKKPVPQYRYRSVISRRHFNQCAIRWSPEEQRPEPSTATTTDESPQDPEEGTNIRDGGFSIRRVGSALKHAQPEKSSFSYPSSKGRKVSRRGDGSTHWGARTGTPSMAPEADNRSRPEELDIPWGEADGTEFDKFDAEFDEFGLDEAPEGNDTIHYEEVDEIERLTQKRDPGQDGTSTITPSERLAFQKIFSDIFARAQPLTPYGPDGLLEEEETGTPHQVASRAAKAKERLGEIVDIGAEERSQIEMKAAVNRYPAALRPAAARAMGLASYKPAPPAPPATAIDQPSIDQQLIEDEKLEQLRKPERDRVEGLMRSASTDFELWTVMQKEVFPLISKLGLKEAAEEDAAPKKSRAKNKSQDLESPPQDNSEQKQALAASDSALDAMSPLDIYGPLYPSYLLLGLRLLDRSFARPSPLTRALLPAIKSLGIISHVLGGSTQLYNELLLIHWYRFDDFRGVLNLLIEMDQFGLSWDKETLGVVEQIIKIQAAVADGKRGVALKALWSLPEFAPGRFNRWRNKIAPTLVEGSRHDTPRIRGE